ncbi:hypothetical protein BJ741DRAFT_647429 [Chytriomyces cf. hyalinus JEL632]|nr:hypothetical protein BJ741DRAFT_647429 [Chytriomyces cf. hyalinus JEL632]
MAPVSTTASEPTDSFNTPDNQTLATEIACLEFRSHPEFIITDSAMSAARCIDACGFSPELVLLTTNKSTPRSYGCLCGMPIGTNSFYKRHNMTECEIPCRDKLPDSDQVVTLNDHCGGFTDVTNRQLWSLYNITYPHSNYSTSVRRIGQPGTSQILVPVTETTTTTTADTGFPLDSATLTNTDPMRGPSANSGDFTTTTVGSREPGILIPTITQTIPFPISSPQLVTVTDSGGRTLVSTIWGNSNIPQSIPSPILVTDNRGNLVTSTVWITARPASSPALVTVKDNNGIIVTSTTWIPVGAAASFASPILVTDSNGNLKTTTTWIPAATTLPPQLTSEKPTIPDTSNPTSLGSSSPFIPVMIVAFVVVLAFVGMTIYQKQITRRRGSDRGVGGMSALQSRLDEDNARGMTDPLTYNFDDAFEGMPGLEPLDSGAGRPKLYKTIVPGENNMHGGGGGVVAATAAGHRTSQIMSSSNVAVVSTSRFAAGAGANSPEEMQGMEDGGSYFTSHHHSNHHQHKSEFSNPSQLSRAMPPPPPPPPMPVPEDVRVEASQSSPIPSRADSSRSVHHKSVLRFFKKK